MKKLITIIMAVTIGFKSLLALENYEILKTSEILIENQVLFVSSNGKIEGIEGFITLKDDKKTLENISASAEVNTLSMRYWGKKLKSTNFFNSLDYPIMKFDTEKVYPNKVLMNLTIKGIKKQIYFDIVYSNLEDDNYGRENKHIQKINLTSFITMSDFNMQEKNSTLSDKIKFTISLSIIK